MAAQDKIEQYNLQDRVLELKGQGSTQVEIAQILTRKLKEEHGIDVSISQSTVQRFLKKVKDERSEEASQYVKDYTKGADWSPAVDDSMDCFYDGICSYRNISGNTS